MILDYAIDWIFLSFFSIVLESFSPFVVYFRILIQNGKMVFAKLKNLADAGLDYEFQFTKVEHFGL
jgi:hypothetical protein